MKNQEIVASGTNQDEKFETTSTSAILELEAGDRICVSLRQGWMYGHSPSHYSSFSGFRFGPNYLSKKKKIWQSMADK